MNRTFAAALLLVAGASAFGAAPYEISDVFAVNNPIDEHVLVVLKEQGIEPAGLCSDEVFVRRVYIDVIGTLPEINDVRRFLADQRPNKRALLIDSLLKRPEYADYWSLKWGDLLRVKAEYPINLWPNAVQAYHRWIHTAMAENMPMDQFARELLTSSGSNFRTPAVNFYRAIQGNTPAAIAEAAALTFMGVRLDKCPAKMRTNLEAFFSRVAYKSTAEWKEEIVYLDPKPCPVIKTAFPDGTPVEIGPDQDPRAVFAEWLTKPDNDWFARSLTNRAWSWLMGRGIVHEPDDIRPDNPPVNPKLLAYLEEELVKSKYDMKHLLRLILNSRTYQQSSIPRGDASKAETFFACYPVRPLDAEVLIDALCLICEAEVEYSSPIPEPFTFVPEEHRTILLSDGSITSQFLEMFGRPARDTGLESERSRQPTDVQRLHLLNSSDILVKIRQSLFLRKIAEANKDNRRELLDHLYLAILSRYPSREEVQAIQTHNQTKKPRPNEIVEDLAWALINTKEFLYRH